MSTNARRIVQSVGAAATVLVLAAACSSSKSSTSPSTTVSSTSPTTTASSTSSSATASGGAGSSVPAATGSPILIGSSGSLQNPAYSEPQLKSGEEAAVSSINAAGGVNGHPLKLNFCDSAYDVNKELSCARELIAAKVVASVHPSILADQSGAEFKLYQAAKVAVFGGLGLSPAELTNSYAYPLGSGLIGWIYGAAVALKDAGAKKIAVFVDNNPASQYFGSLAVGALKELGLADVGTIVGDPKADPTFAAAAAKASGTGADGIIMASSPVNLANSVKSLKHGGYSGKLATIAPLVPAPILQALGANANGILVSSQFAFVTDTSNSGVAKFTTDMKTYQPSAVVDDTSLSGWSAIQLFAKIMATSTATTIDSAAFNDAINNLSTPIDIGSVAPYAVKGVTSPVAAYSRVLNPTVQIGTIQGGKIVADGNGFINPFTGK